MNETKREYKASSKGSFEKGNLVVLVDENSASASEIVSGAVQDWDRGVIIGRRSYGKGLVQKPFFLTDGSMVRLTIAHYYTPSGRCIQKLDYSRKNKDGVALAIPDSLLVPYKTSKGRVVLDGEGVTPDIKIKGDKASEVLIALSNKNILFDFGTKYYYEKDSITSIDDFKVSDELYNEFVAFTKESGFEFETETERKVNSFKENFKEGNSTIDIETEIAAVQEKIQKSKEDDLIEFKEEIKKELKVELASRYYLKEGVIRATILNNKEVDTALDVLKDDKRYKEILKITE